MAKILGDFPNIKNISPNRETIKQIKVFQPIINLCCQQNNLL